MKRTLFCLLFLFLALAAASAQSGTDAQATPTPAVATPTPAQDVPVIDGAIGPCSVSFFVTQDGKPVYNAQIKVHIAYGTMGIKKLDLQAGTNVDGKVKFTGLPLKVHNPPLLFNASLGSATGLASYNPATECSASHQIALVK